MNAQKISRCRFSFMSFHQFQLLKYIIVLLIACGITPGNSQVLKATVIDQLTRPVGVVTDLNGNIFVTSDGISYALLTRYGIDGHKREQQLGDYRSIDLATARMALDTKKGMIYMLLSTGQILTVDPQKMAVQPLLPVPFIGDVANDAYEIMTRQFRPFAFIQPSYGDIAVYRINDKLLDIFVSGRTLYSPDGYHVNPPLGGPVYFVMRLRFDENAWIFTPKVVAWGQAAATSYGYSNAAGIAINSDGTVLTTLPALAGTTYMALVSFRNDFPENRAQADLLPRYLFLNNQGNPTDFSADGMTSGPDGRFYLATTGVGSSECGVGGSGSLMMVSRDLSRFLCLPSDVILNRTYDVSVDTQNKNIYLTNLYGLGYLLRFNVPAPDTYTLSASKVGSGSGTVTSNPAGISCGADCSESYASGTGVILIATPDTDSTFAGWSGACTGTGNCAVTMNAAKSVTATFSSTLYALTTVKAGTGSGTVGGNGSYTAGAMVTLTATPAAGSAFGGWSPSPCAPLFTMPANVLTCTATFTVAVGSPLVLSGDFAGGGTAGLLWQNARTGQVYEMLLNNSSIAQQGPIYTEPNTAWRIVGNGDFTGDGKSDLVWWNNQTGQVYLMFMNGLSITGGQMIYQEPHTAWQIVAVGDLNGDGKTDLIWWNNQTGHVYGMLMNSDTITQGGMIYQEPDTNWRILAARNFTDDGKADLLWYNIATGHVYLMAMNGLSIGGGAMVYQEPSLAWRIVAINDLNADGKADLVWWNNQTGHVYGMLMDGATITQRGMMYQEQDTTWQIVASGDYNGDHRADLLWRNTTTGQIYAMRMNGLTVTGGAVIYQEADANWRIVANAEVPRLPAKSLAGAHYTHLTGESLNPLQDLTAAPINPEQPFTGEPLSPAPSLPAP